MIWPAFQTRASGKWVLAGEHAVLRGASAIALPHPEYGLSLSFEPKPLLAGLQVEPLSATSVVQELLEGVLGVATKLPDGKLQIQSSIPIGAGLGSSAALCVAVSRWLSDPLQLAEAEILAFATRLEHRFHGKSSGMDIAVIAMGQPVLFSMQKGPIALNVKKTPRFTFHDTGIRAQTRTCVQKVEEYVRNHPADGLRRDEEMGMASRMAMDGLILYDGGNSEQTRGLQLIQKSMRQAQECFYSWGLVPPEAQQLEAALLSKGAMAVKMTGAGGGGMMVSLWEDSISSY